MTNLELLTQTIASFRHKPKLQVVDLITEDGVIVIYLNTEPHISEQTLYKKFNPTGYNFVGYGCHYLDGWYFRFKPPRQ